MHVHVFIFCSFREMFKQADPLQLQVGLNRASVSQDLHSVIKTLFLNKYYKQYMQTMLKLALLNNILQWKEKYFLY